MLRLFRREQKTSAQHFLVLDIGTDVIKALICQASGENVFVIGAGRERQNAGNMQSGTVLDIGGIIDASSKAIQAAQQQARASPRDVIIGIAGELVKGMTHKSTFMRSEPGQKIDLGELKNIIHKIQWKSFEETRRDVAFETGENEIDIKLVNAAITDMRIDGYQVKNPIGFQGKEVEISMFNAFAPLTHFGAIQTIIAELELALLAIAAEPFALARSLETEDAPLRSAIFIDVGGSTTDIAVVQNSVLQGTKMFTVGGRTFTKRLASSLNISMPEAEEIKLAYAGGKLEKQSEKIVIGAFEPDSEVWLTGVAFTLSEFGLENLPQKIYLCGGGSHLPEIKARLQGSAWTENLPFQKPPSVSILSPKQITEVKDMTKSLIDPQDVMPVALAKLGLEYAGHGHMLGALLKKVVRLMEI